MPEIRVGISGWTYARWHGDFYPKDLPRQRELEYASNHFNSIELNGSFYKLIKPETWRRYYEQTPSGFLFAVKGSRYISHIKKLRDVQTPLANFFASGVLELKEKLGPVLWQFSARGPALERFEEFLEWLPRDSDAARRLARKHDQRVSDPVLEGKRRSIRYAFEVRDPKMITPEFTGLLRRYGAALVFSHSGSFPYAEEITAGFIYLRLHGAPNTYADRYPDEELDQWAKKIRCWAEGDEPPGSRRITGRKPPPRKSRNVYVYLDNDGLGHAPHDARRLMERLSAMQDHPRACASSSQ